MEIPDDKNKQAELLESSATILDNHARIYDANDLYWRLVAVAPHSLTNEQIAAETYHRARRMREKAEELRVEAESEEIKTVAQIGDLWSNIFRPNSPERVIAVIGKRVICFDEKTGGASSQYAGDFFDDKVWRLIERPPLEKNQAVRIKGQGWSVCLASGPTSKGKYFVAGHCMAYSRDALVPIELPRSLKENG